MQKIAYPNGQTVKVRLPYYFFTESQNDTLPMEDEIYGRIEGHVITLIRFVSPELSVVIFSRLWHPDNFPRLDTGNPFTECRKITREKFETAQMSALKMLRIQ